MRLELKLKEIHLQNFRLFDDLKVSFDEQLTVFISENGAGKTSLLEGIAKALYGFGAATDIATDLAKKMFLKNILNNLDVQYLKNQGFINLETIVVQDGKVSFLDWCIEMQLNNNRLTLSLNEESVKKLNRLQKSIVHANKLLTLESLPVIVYYGSERASKNSTQVRGSQVALYNNYQEALMGNSLNFKQFVEWFDWQTRIELSTKTPNAILQQVKSAILSLLNDVDTTFFDDLFIDPSQFRNPRLMVSKSGNQLEINQLSSGEKSLFGLVSDLTQRLCLANPQSANPLKEGQGIVLIDEIDLHLHPHWQRKILTQLKSIFPNIQWVVTTHSPFVLAAEEVHPKNAYLLTDEIKSDGTTQKIAVSIEDLGKFNQGLEPNRILSEIMRVPLRNQATETEIQQLHQLLNPKDFEKPVFEQLFQQLSHKLGIHDPVMVRASHRISVLKRQKQNEVH
jgi:predicted ATP-binding protein involved in virulence